VGKRDPVHHPHDGERGTPLLTISHSGTNVLLACRPM